MGWTRRTGWSWHNGQWIDFVEVYNMYDSINRSVDDILRFARFINALNSGRPDLVRPLLAGHEPALPDAELARIAASTGSRPLVPVCGSDSTGRSSTIPGMGFIFQSHIIGPHRRRFLEKHFALPEFVSRIIAARGSYISAETETEPADAIISMGKSTHFISNKIGDETDVAPIPLGRALRYLNPVLLNFLCVGVGFLLTVVTIGWQYALVWFGITGLRHVIVDLVARRGSRVREWSLREIDYRNIARSLFWTGVSVPLLAFVKSEFDLLWPLGTTGHLYQFSKFFCISFINGLYLVMHNILRGFEKGVTRANFFRNIISWPFASLFAPAGDLLFIPTIVQSKLWSDVVGGFIEGWGKFIRSVGLTRRDLSEIIPPLSRRRSRCAPPPSWTFSTYSGVKHARAIRCARSSSERGIFSSGSETSRGDSRPSPSAGTTSIGASPRGSIVWTTTTRWRISSSSTTARSGRSC